MKFKIIIILSCLIAFASIYFSFTPNKSNIPYDLSSPLVKIKLPNILHEISGLTTLSDSTVACVQDEKGIVFIYDFVSKKIKKEINFAEDGDYEGIALVNNSLFVLRSDGDLFEIKDYLAPSLKIIKHNTKVQTNNNEGICYDETKNRLLIASKSKIKNNKNLKNKRHIYSFNLKRKKAEGLAYLLDINEFNNQLTHPIKEKIKFKMSGIAIHPFTNDLYILSAADYMLFIFNKTGKLKHAINLNHSLFNKAEGISFLKNGDLLIANEGQENTPTLLIFNYFK